jgi:hypothetical protein
VRQGHVSAGFVSIDTCDLGCLVRGSEHIAECVALSLFGLFAIRNRREAVRLLRVAASSVGPCLLPPSDDAVDR